MNGIVSSAAPQPGIWSWRLLVLEAMARLSIFSLLLRLLPAARIGQMLGKAEAPLPGNAQQASDSELAQARAIGLAVARAGQALPWRPLCLPQALAARAMLARRGSHGVLHLGATTASGAGTHPVAAHAWLTLGSLTITGAAERAAYPEIARYG